MNVGMGITFKRGQVWEDETGARLRIVDEKVGSGTELYLAPVKLHVEPVGTELPDEDLEPVTGDEKDDERYKISRDTLLQRCNIINSDS